MPRGLISELEMAAAKGDFHPTELSQLVDRAVDMTRLLMRENHDDETAQGVVYYLSIASRRAHRLSKDEATEILLDAADALRVMLERNKGRNVPS